MLLANFQSTEIDKRRATEDLLSNSDYVESTSR